MGKKLTPAESVQVFDAGIEVLQSVEPFALHELEEAFHAHADAMGIKVGSFFAPFRVAITE